MSYTLETLASGLKGTDYTPLTEEEIMRQAQAQYQAAYEREVLGAQQAHDAGELSYDRQLGQIEKSYGQQAELLQKQTTQSVSETDRRALSRGMQRSSYNLATLANVKLSGDRASAALGEAKLQADANIAAERALKAQQLAQQLLQAQRDYEANVMTYADKLRDREYQRATDAARYQNELAMAMYEYTNQLALQAQQQDRWLMEFNESLRRYEQSQAGKSSGGTGGTKSTATPYITSSSGLKTTVAAVANKMPTVKSGTGQSVSMLASR